VRSGQSVGSTPGPAEAGMRATAAMGPLDVFARFELVVTADNLTDTLPQKVVSLLLPHGLSPETRGIVATQLDQVWKQLVDATVLQIERAKATLATGASLTDVRIKLDIAMEGQFCSLVKESLDKKIAIPKSGDSAAIRSLIQETCGGTARNAFIRLNGFIVEQENRWLARTAVTSTTRGAVEEPAGEAGFDGPELIGEMATHLGTILRLSPYCLLPACLTVVSGAVGKAARLLTPVWPGPLIGGLHLAYSDADGRLSRALEFILQPLRELQSARFMEESESMRKWIRKRIKRLEKYHEPGATCLMDDGRVDGHPAQIAALRLRLKPFIMVENPAPGQLLEAMDQCADATLLVTYDDTSLGRLLDKAKTKRGERDFQLLRHGWEGRTFRTGGKRPCPIVQPCVSCLIVCDPENLGRLLSLEEPAVEQFRRQLVTLAACDETDETPVQASQGVALFNRWQQWLRGLVCRRLSGADYQIRLTSGAETAALKHWRQDRPQSRPAPDSPVLAAKFALGSQAEYRGCPEVSGSAMEYSIQLAQWCSDYSAGLKGVLTTKSRQPQLELQAAKMLDRIRERGPITPRDLYRTYDCQRKELHQPVLERLINTGQVRCVDGLVEAVTVQNQCSPGDGMSRDWEQTFRMRFKSSSPTEQERANNAERMIRDGIPNFSRFKRMPSTVRKRAGDGSQETSRSVSG